MYHMVHVLVPLGTSFISSVFRNVSIPTLVKYVKGSYCEKIILLIHAWIRLDPELQFMQDGAPAHSATYTKQELSERGIHTIFWPAYSPDLNLTEAVWNKMKGHIKIHYPDLPVGQQRTYEQLREFVQEAWDSISVEYLSDLVSSMQGRCQAMIDAAGGHTKY